LVYDLVIYICNSGKPYGLAKPL